MKPEYCPACTYGPSQNAHNGHGEYCSTYASTKRPGLVRRVINFIAGTNKESH